MALPSTLVLEARVTGDDRNGAGFDPSVTSPGVDFSQQDAAAVVYTDLVIGATTTNVTSAGNPFGATHVGNTVQVAAIYAPVVTAIVSVTGGGSTGGSLQAGAYRLKYTFVGSTGSGTGESTVSPETAQFTVAAGNIPQVTLPPLPPGVTSIKVYLTAAGGATNTETLYASGVTAQTYNLSAAQSAGASPPSVMPSGFQGGFYNIRSVASAVATLDRSCGSAAATGGAGRLGGALGSPGMAAAAKVAGNVVHWKSGTYTAATTLTNVSGGCVNDNTGGTTSGVGTTRGWWRGYATVRGDAPGLGSRPVFKCGAGVSNATLWLNNAPACSVQYVTFDGNAQTNSTCLNTVNQTQANIVDCDARNATNGFALSRTDNLGLRCYATACTTGFSGVAGTLMNCHASGNGVGFNGAATFTNCIADNNTGDGFQINNSTAKLLACTSALNGGSGFNLNVSGPCRQLYLTGCLAARNSGSGFLMETTRDGGLLENCAHYQNTSGNTLGSNTVSNLIALTADPFIDATNGNFALNNNGDAFGQTTGLTGVIAGRYLRGAGMGTFPGLSSTVGYPDIGAVQSQAAGGGLLFGADLSGGYE